MVQVKATPETTIQHTLPVGITIAADRRREGDGKVGVVLPCPTIGEAITLKQRVVDHAQISPYRLSLVVVDAMTQVDDDTAFVIGEGVLMNAYPLGCCQLRLDAVVAQLHLVITRLAMLRAVGVTGAIALVGMTGPAWLKMKRTIGRHNQHVAEIAMASTAEVGMAEPHDGGVMILIACAIGIDLGLVSAINVMRYGVGLRAELYDAERRAGTREGVTHAIGAYHRVDIRRHPLLRRHHQGQRKEGQIKYMLEKVHLFLIYWTANS